MAKIKGTVLYRDYHKKYAKIRGEDDKIYFFDVPDYKDEVSFEPANTGTKRLSARQLTLIRRAEPDQNSRNTAQSNTDREARQSIPADTKQSQKSSSPYRKSHRGQNVYSRLRMAEKQNQLLFFVLAVLVAVIILITWKRY